MDRDELLARFVQAPQRCVLADETGTADVPRRYILVPRSPDSVAAR